MRAESTRLPLSLVVLGCVKNKTVMVENHLSYIVLCLLLHTVELHRFLGSAGTELLCLLISSTCKLGQCGINHLLCC